MRHAVLSLSVVALACSGAPQSGTPGASTDSTQTTSTQVCVSPAALPTPAVRGKGDSLDDALATVALDRSSFALTQNAVDQNGLMPPRDPRRLADLDAFGRSPLAMAAWGSGVASSIDTATTSPHPVSELLALAQARRRNAGATVGPTSSCSTLVTPNANDARPLGTALDALGALPTDVSGVPLDLQRALVPIVAAMAHASDVVTAARAKAPLLTELNAAPSWLLGSYKLRLRAELTAAMESFDVDALTDAARGVTLAIEEARLERFRDTPTAALEVATPYGAFVLAGPRADTFAHGSPAEHAWLLVDTGGDDTYRVPAGGAYLDQGVSVAIDLGGDDVYGYDAVPATGDVGHRLPSDGQGRVNGQTRSRVTRQGAAVLGIGMLFDLGGGKDRRRSLALSQGSAVFGVGVSYDDGGDDTYEAEVFSQSASAWGIGLLIDQGGNDRYFAYRQAQGFGDARGASLLVDAAGDDSFTTDSGVPSQGGDPIYPSAQLPGASNESFSQGCGAGRRPDEPDVGFPFPGGVGVLRDRAGNDAYASGVFAQASGFAMGIGALLDGAGDDTYDGLYYVQGTAAHLAGAVFLDASGNDRYESRYEAAAGALGEGHDVSSAAMLDLGGDDLVNAPALGAGVGSANGLGLMLVVGGRDTFRSKYGGAWGVSNPASPLTAWRTQEKTAGVFVHAGGPGSYSGEGTLETNKTRTHKEGVLLSVGLDRPAGSAQP